MSIFTTNHYEDAKPNIQMAPLIDIVFLTLVFFMTLSVFTQMESEIEISVPKSTESKEAVRSPGEVIINVSKDGEFIVNQKKMTITDLEVMLKKVSTLFPDQPVIIRADEKTYHQHIIEVLDACAKADIWDISFAADNVSKE